MTEQNEISEFLELLYRYVCLSGNLKRIKNEIGIRRAIVLKNFLCEYLEQDGQNVHLYAESFLENKPFYAAVIKNG